MTLSVQYKYESRFDPTELSEFLQDTYWAIARIKKKTDLVGKDAFWYPSKADLIGPHFGVLPAPFLVQLTWGDVLAILRGLDKMYLSNKIWAEIAFLIDDSERDALGSGVLKPGRKEPTSDSGGSNSGTATS